MYLRSGHITNKTYKKSNKNNKRKEIENFGEKRFEHLRIVSDEKVILGIKMLGAIPKIQARHIPMQMTLQLIDALRTSQQICL